MDESQESLQLPPIEEIVHEIKNPLSYLINYGQISVKQLDDLDSSIIQDPNLKKSLNQLKSNLRKICKYGDKLDKIIQSITHATKKVPPVWTTINFPEFIDDILDAEFQRSTIKGYTHDVVIHKNITEVPTSITLPKEELERVLTNILDNAVDSLFLKKESISDHYKPEIKITGKVEGDCLIIILLDNGLGISSELLEKIFQPYYTTKKQHGTGLGLAICREIVKVHLKGDLSVKGKEGEFAEFTIKIPLANKRSDCENISG